MGTEQNDWKHLVLRSVKLYTGWFRTSVQKLNRAQGMLHWTIWGRGPGIHEANLRKYGSKLVYHITIYFLFTLVTVTCKYSILTQLTYAVSLLYDLADGSACRRGPCDLHCISPLISLWRPHRTSSSLVRQSDLCSRPVHTWIKLRCV